ncbi:class I SAM-dependent methyltransferase [Frankia sp. Cj3]|uniref:class I SAM-dependent methyltransferase n=1 Tax=Frankia sp. Cj3 TaxID=2880976 RepID=UPI001EF4D57E|nr:class I SAM-dependent methyltransferase [Frankia sp. Cj3]
MNARKIAAEAVRDHGALQKEGELASFLAALADVHVEVVVEIGCDAGGTLWAWQQLPGVRRVIGVDLPKAEFSTGRELDRAGAEMVIFGDSHADDVRNTLVGVLGNEPIDLLFIDGDHTYEGVRQDYEMYSPLVRPGGVIAFHDVGPHPAIPSVGVGRFWSEIRGTTIFWDETLIGDPTWAGIGWMLKTPAVVAQ